MLARSARIDDNRQVEVFIMEMVKQFIADFYLGSYWIPLFIAAIVFALFALILAFFEKPKPLALPAWLSLSCALFGLLGYVEKTKDELATAGFPETVENLQSMYKWFMIGIIAVVLINGLALLIGFIRRKHNARRK